MAAAGFTLTISAVDKATAVAKRVNDSIAKMTKPVNDVKASVAAFSKETGLDQLGKRFESVGKSAASVARGVASIAPPLAAIVGVGSIAGIAAFATSWGKAATEIANTSSVLGVSTTNLQRYRGAARVAGLSADTMTSSMQALGSAFEDASAGRNTFAQGVMNSMGITQHRLKDGSIDVIRGINDVANAAKKFTNTEAQRKFLDIFGIGGLQAMIRRGTIGQFVAQFDKLHATMSPEQIAQGEKFNQSMIALDTSVDKLKNSIGASLAPAVGRAVDEFARLADQYGPKIANWIDHIDWDKTAKSIANVGDSLGGVKGVALALAAVTFASPILGLVGIASKLGLIAGFATNPVVAALAGGYFAETSRQKALDKAIPAGANHDQAVAEAQAGGVVTPQSGASPGGFGKLGDAVRSMFKPSSNKVPRGIRNNNPGNIKYGDFARRMGATGRDDGGFAVFPTMTAGQGAARQLLGSYASSGFDTTSKIISRWAPSSENDTGGYIAQVSKELGVSPDQKLNSTQLDSLSQAIFRRENGASAMASLYAKNTSAAADTSTSSGAAVGPGSAAQNATPSGLKGHLEITLHMPNAPQGTRATVHSNGNVLATGQIGHSMLLGPNV